MVQGARVAGIVGKKEVEARGFDSPLQFRSMDPAGVGAAAMVAAEVCGHGWRERGRLGVSRHGAKGERGEEGTRCAPYLGPRRDEEAGRRERRRRTGVRAVALRGRRNELEAAEAVVG